LATSQLFGYAHSKTHITSTAGPSDNLQTATVDHALANASSAIPSVGQAILQETHLEGHRQQHLLIMHQKTLLSLRVMKQTGEQ